MYKFVATCLFLILTSAFSVSKDAPAEVINWPDTGSPVVRVSLGKFKELSSIGGQRNYMIETTVENLWGKKISHLTFPLYLFDKNKARIGDGWISVEGVAPGQIVKFQTTVELRVFQCRRNLSPNRCLPNCNLWLLLGK